MENCDRSYATINIAHLYYNINEIKKKENFEKKIIAVIKSNAYGHNDIIIARALTKIGVDFFAVATIDEAIHLRNNGFLQSILILGYTAVSRASELEKYNLIQTIIDFDYALMLNKQCYCENIVVMTHIKIDTGMSRLGIDSKDILHIKKVIALQNIDVKGIFSHLSSSDSTDKDDISYTNEQIKRFDTAVSLLKAEYQFEAIHLQNSAGACLYSCDYTYDRIGIAMYGLPPSGTSEFPIKLRPVMEIKSLIVAMRKIKKGTAVSYSRTFVAPYDMTIAVVPIGYADGYSRMLSNKGEMLIRGKRAKVIGNVCMDQTIIDVTNIDDIVVGDVVTVVGKDHNDEITLTELANLIGTINYELVCGFSNRLPRVIIDD